MCSFKRQPFDRGHSLVALIRAWTCGTLGERGRRKSPTALGDTERWHSHGRAIDMVTLRDEVGLKIDDLADLPADIIRGIRGYFDLLKDYMQQREMPVFVHSTGYF